MKTISTHILDTNRGRPASKVSVSLEVERGAVWHQVGDSITNEDGRISHFGNVTLEKSLYLLTFDTKQYFENLELPTFYPRVQIVFYVDDPSDHYHVPLLLSAHGYSTYRGS